MKQITNLMVNEFKINKLGYDFMGYKIKRNESLTFHHLIVPHRDCKRKKIPNDGYIRSNGAILRRLSHDYLHIIERYDYDLFLQITSEMIDMNIKGYLDEENIQEINKLLEQFESEFKHESNSKNKVLIKSEYINDRVFKGK